MNASCRSTSGCVFINLYRISTYLSLGKAMTESCNIVPILSIYRSRRRLYPLVLSSHTREFEV